MWNYFQRFVGKFDQAQISTVVLGSWFADDTYLVLPTWCRPNCLWFSRHLVDIAKPAGLAKPSRMLVCRPSRGTPCPGAGGPEAEARKSRGSGWVQYIGGIACAEGRVLLWRGGGGWLLADCTNTNCAEYKMDDYHSLICIWETNFIS